ncbi:BcPKS1, polyketide synthase [Xylariomycetidae sp. FL0641]|nr:BcPKS1, polyketide synthase [Xylariomycetidae sp. FL0641]
MSSPPAFIDRDGAVVEDEPLEPLAIIGMAIKFPQEADSLEGLWKILEERRCVMTEWPDDRLRLDAFISRGVREAAQKHYVPGAHFLEEHLGAFDASFFGINAAEAKAMDPQHRLLLETTYHALENAGIPKEDVYGSKTGVYTGCMMEDYKHILTKDLEQLPKYAATGVPVSMLANRISWFYNFCGPSVNLDSACSSSLMAFDIACQGLRNKDCNMAVVSGASVAIAPETFLTLINMGFLSPQGRCFSFDDRADGYSRGEGVGVVLIKRLDDALRDKDVIRAVVRSSGSNQDGYTPGLTQPSVEAQAALICETYKKAGLTFDSTRFFESHGTGTPIGDPVEANAIGRTFRKASGALKSNIGHLEGGSGVAGIIKTVLVLEKGIIPPNANFERLNPKIDASFLNIKFPTECIPWPSTGLRRASVASFGFGGSNAHAILDDAYSYLESRRLMGRHCTRTDSLTTQRGNQMPLTFQQPKLLVLSAADEDGIQRTARSYQSHFIENEHVDPDHLIHTLSSRRSILPWRSFGLIHSTHDLTSLPNRLSKPVLADTKPAGIALVFTGQGSQYINMGFGLLSNSCFNAWIGLIDEQLIKLGCPCTLRSVISQKPDVCDIDDPRFSQPMTTGLQIALYEMLKAINITPTVVVGHSSGEIAAAYATGALSLSSALRVSYFRGKFAAVLKASSTGTGAMLAADLSVKELRMIIDEQATGKIHIACVNSPRNTTVSGYELDIDTLKQYLDKRSIRSRKLRTGVAYHSPHMRSVAAEYARSLSGLSGCERQTACPQIISSVTGKLVPRLDNCLCTPEYWVANLVSPVEFLEAMSTLSKYMGERRTRKLGEPKVELVRDIVEIGPHSALRRPILECLGAHATGAGVRYHTALIRGSSASHTWLTLVGSLFVQGYTVDLAKANGSENCVLSSSRLLVDLPSYPFDHSKIYWQESEASKQSRLRMAPKTELLGVPVSEWNPHEACWRKFFDLSETAWVGHHKVNGKIIYPATGMLVMAIEGATQIADTGREIATYELTNASFSAPIHLTDSARVEVKLHMRAEQSNSNKKPDSWEFTVYTNNDHEWFQNCRGSIKLVYKNGDDTSWEKESAFYRGKLESFRQACRNPVPAKDMYANFVSNGITYGHAFQVLDNLAWDGGSLAIGDVRCFQWLAEDSQHLIQPHVVHPVTLDATGQLGWVSLTEGAQNVLSNGMAVTRLQKATIVASGLSYPATHHLHAASKTTPKGLRGNESSIFALDSTGELKVVISGLETTMIEGNFEASREIPPNPIGYEMIYLPDVGLLDSAQLEGITKQGISSEDEPVEFYEELELVLFYFISRVVKPMDPLDHRVSSTNPTISRYLQWLQHQLQRHREGRLPCARSDWGERIKDADAMGRAIDRVNTEDGELFVHIGGNLHSILSGLADPLELLFSDNHAERYYESVCDKMRCCKQLSSYLQLLSHKNPHLDVLEVGAGTGSFTTKIHEALGHRSDAVNRYDYTDISEAFFERARARFKAFDPKIFYRKLDIERDPIEQGYQAERYDVVCAGWALHATHHLEATLRHVRKLLKPGGKLILLEITEPDRLRAGVVFGLLSGWWLGAEPERMWSPCMSESQWNALLCDHGFRGVDIVMRDFESDTCHESSILIATAASTHTSVDYNLPDAAREFEVVIHPESNLQTQVALALRNSEGRNHGSVHRPLSVLDAESLCSLNRRPNLIILVELGMPYMETLDRTQFETMQSLVNAAGSIIWVSSASKMASSWAGTQISRGFARALSTEKPGRAFVTMSLEDHGSSYETYSDHIHHAMDEVHSGGPIELEYVEDDGLLTINRVFESGSLKNTIHSKTHAIIQHQALGSSPPLKLAVPNPGLLDSIRFEEDLSYFEPLGADEVEVKVEAIGINFRDLLVVLGRLDARTVGCDCAGTISRIGSNCTTAFEVGDRVCAPIMGCCSTFARCHHRLLVKIPESMSTIEAASLPVTGATAYYSLYTLARLQKGESVLIHCGAGGTGQMAIQMAQAVGADVYVTVGSNEKRQLMKDLYSIPEDRIFYSRDTSFARDIYRATDGKGVDVIVNSLSGQALAASWECIAPCGRFIELGRSDIQANSKLSMQQFDKNVFFFAVALDYLTITRPATVGEALQSTMGMIVAKSIKTASPLHVFPISHVETAFRSMQSGKNTGKMILTMNPETEVPTWLRPKYSCQLNPDVSYLIAGGFGGLGICAARWMVQRGARHMIFLSRTGPKSSAARGLLHELQEQGVQVRAPRCDVSSAPSLAAALGQCSSLPPVKGCLQCTMVLQDALFETMSWEQWSTTIRSKVTSSWNLHFQLPRHLDFFIMLSSIAGLVGSMGQANYAAANTYQDGLADHRLALGEKATSINLGWMGNLGIGGVETDLLKGKEEVAGLMEISEAEFLAVLDCYCDDPVPTAATRLAHPTQPIIGLMSPAKLRSSGIEPPDWLLERPLFKGLRQQPEGSAGPLQSELSTSILEGRDWTYEFVQASTMASAVDIIVEAISHKLSKATSAAPEEIDRTRPLHVHGVDSLLAVELRNWFARIFKADVAIFDITGQVSLEKLAEIAAKASDIARVDRLTEET